MGWWGPGSLTGAASPMDTVTWVRPRQEPRTAHLTALELDVDQKGPAGDAQGARPPGASRGLQLQGEAVLQPGLPAQLLAAGGRLLAELAHLGSKVVHFRVAQRVKLVEA